MATLTIRNLPDDVHAALRVRAAKAGRSMEEEVRVMISEKAQSETVKRFDRADARAAASEIRDLLRAANGGRMPRDSVDAFLADKRAEVAREEAEFAEMVARHRDWGLK
jgi:plasmid stability protein